MVLEPMEWHSNVLLRESEYESEYGSSCVTESMHNHFSATRIILVFMHASSKLPSTPNYNTI